MNKLPNEVLTHICEYVVANGDISAIMTLNKHFYSNLLNVIKRYAVDNVKMKYYRKKFTEYRDLMQKYQNIEKQLIRKFIRELVSNTSEISSHTFNCGGDGTLSSPYYYEVSMYMFYADKKETLIRIVEYSYIEVKSTSDKTFKTSLEHLNYNILSVYPAHEGGTTLIGERVYNFTFAFYTHLYNNIDAYRNLAMQKYKYYN